MLNFHELKKSEILWLWENRCEHGSRYTEHPGCFEKEHPDGIRPERIAILDIESLGFTANWGYILCYCLKELDKPVIKRVLTTREVRTYKFDKILLKQFQKDITPFNRFVVYYGKDRRHDLPFLRSRTLKWGIDFPIFREKYVTDLYDIVKAKLRLHNNRLATACRFFNIAAKDHPIIPDVWCKALAGHQPSLDYILLHCEEDVIATEKLFKEIIPFVRKSKTSI